jgi:hypothetical protein
MYILCADKLLVIAGEKPWLGTWLTNAIKSGKIDIKSVDHIHRMLKQVKKYDLKYAQMEFEPEAGGGDFQPSDWLIGVRSEAEMSRLLEHGFMYWDKNEDGAPRNPEPWEYELEESDGPISLSIPVIREEQGELIQLTGLRTPSFAIDDHVVEAFQESLHRREKEHIIIIVVIGIVVIIVIIIIAAFQLEVIAGPFNGIKWLDLNPKRPQI